MCKKKDQGPKEKPEVEAEKEEEQKEWKDIIHLPDDLEYDVH